jgi:hypothetical protein
LPEEGGSGAESGQAATTLLGSDEYYSAFITDTVTLGFQYNVYVTANSSEDRDVLVDVLDSTGWYAGARKTIPAGQVWGEKIAIQLPASVKDPKSVYLSMKVVPVGKDWRSAVHQENTPLKLLSGTTIPVSLKYGGTLKAWDYDFWRGNSNHDSYSAQIGLSDAAPFAGAYSIRTSWGGFGSFSKRELNLETGVVGTINGSYGSPSEWTLSAPPTSKSGLLPYVKALSAVQGGVSQVATSGQGTSPFLEYPQLAESQAYTKSIQERVIKQWGPLLVAPKDSPSFAIGAGNSVWGVETVSEVERDLLVDLFVDGRWVTGDRTSVPVGYANLQTPNLMIPTTVTARSKGVVYLKLLPKGADWKKKIAEVSVPVTFRGPELLGYYNLSDGEGNDTVVPGGRLFASGNVSATRAMDVRVDVFDAAGKWLSGAQGPTAPGEWGYTYEVVANVPSNVAAGSTLTVYTKVLPPGGAWNTYTDEDKKTVTVR